MKKIKNGPKVGNNKFEKQKMPNESTRCLARIVSPRVKID